MKLNHKLKISTILLFLITTFPTFTLAQEIKDNLDDNIYKERRELIKRNLNIDNTLTIGWFVGAADSFEFRDILVRYMPISNFLSNRTGELVVFMTDKSAEKLSDEALVGNIELLYTNVLEGSRLVGKGWKPLVGRTEDLIGTIVMRSDVSNPDSIEGKKIVGVDGVVTTNYVKYALYKNNLLSKVLFFEQNTSQNELIQILKSKQIDGVVVRDGFAERFVKENLGYKIMFKAPPAKGHIIFVSPAISSSLSSVDIIRKAMLGLTPDTKIGKKLLSGLDGYSDNDKVPFSSRDNEDLKLANEVREALIKLPKFDKFNERVESLPLLVNSLPTPIIIDKTIVPPVSNAMLKK